MPLLETLATVAPLISTGANFLSGIFGNKSNADINAQQREWQSAENEKSRNFTAGENSLDRGMQNYWNQKSLDWQEKMWNLQNQYNTPSAMMERYKEAGLNPFLSMASGQSIGAGAGAAGSAGSPSVSAGGSHSTAPMGSVPGAIPMQSPRFDIDALGVSANVANQNARTQQQKWETYQYIRQHVGSDAAKKYLDSNPDMFQSSSPGNDPWMRAYLRSESLENLQIDRNAWELDLRRLFGVKLAEQEIRSIDAYTRDLDSQISKRKWDVDEIKHTLNLIDERVRTEKSVQVKNYSESDLAAARADTENKIRDYVVRQVLLNTNILEFNEQSQRAIFESHESLRGWLTSSEAKEAFAKAARNRGLWDADAVRSSLLEFLDHVNVGTNVPGVYNTETGFKSGRSDYNHDVNRSGSSHTKITYP